MRFTEPAASNFEPGDSSELCDSDMIRATRCAKSDGITEQ